MNAASFGRTDILKYLHDQGFDLNETDQKGSRPIDGAIGRSTDNIRVFEYGANGPFNAPGQNQKVIWQGSQEEANARWQAARDAGDAINSRNLTYNFWGSDLNGPRDPNAPPPDAVAGNSNSVNKTLIDGMGLQLPSMPTMAPGTENELLPRSIIDQIRQNNNVTNQKSDLIDNTLDSEGRVITSIERNTAPR